jgi:uncharacterized protein (TIGR03118 family)
LLSSGFVQTALVSDIAGLAPHTDSALLNPWGFTVSSRGDFQISDNNGGNAALFASDGTALGAPIVMPPPGGSPAGSTGAPTGQVLNSTSDFVISEGSRSAPASALFSTEDGTIIGFNSAVDPSNGILAADQSAAGAVYKGLAMGSAGGADFLYAANFRSGTVDVFDTNFALHTFSTSQFTDPNAPAGFAPFGIKNIDGTLFVTYAKQNAAKHDDVEGPGNGFVDEFDTSGDFLMRFASGTAAGGSLTEFNSPWGMAVAPHGFGKFSGDLLVGNFGDSHVNVFNLKSGHFLGQLEDPNGQPLVLNGGFHGPSDKGLWGIGFGNGQGGAGKRTLFFASGINDEADGLFGMVNVAKANGQDGNSQGNDRDGNSHWSDPVKSLVVVPSPVIDGSGLNAVAAIAANDIWAVGGVLTSTGAHTTLAEHFNGTSWSVVQTPAVNDPLVAVAGSASNDVWAIGSQGNIAESPTPFITHWNGTSWSIVDSPKLPKDSSLTGVTAPASNDAWVVGHTFSSSTGIVEHWDGTRWSIVSNPAFTNVVAFAIAADSSTDVWAFGLSNATGAPVALHFDGTTWTAITAANNRFGFEVGGLAVLSPTNVWAVGASATGEPLDTLRPAAEHWDGTSWSFVPVPNPDQGTRFRDFLSGVAAISANDIWAVGVTSSGTLTEHWDGTSWSVIASPDPGKVTNSLSGVTALSDGTVAAVGQQVGSKVETGLTLQNAASAPPK